MSDSIRTTVSLPASVESGTPVSITVRLTNASDAPATVDLTGRDATADVVIRNQSGTVVWRHLAGRATLSILTRRRLAPGATIEQTITWEQQTADGGRVAPGTYAVTGLFLSPETDYRSEPTDLVIE